MQTNLSLQEQSSASDEERVDAPTTRFFTSRDAVASDDGCHGKSSLVPDKSQLVFSSKRSLDTASSKTCEAQSSSLSTKDAARMTVPFLEKLTYNSILRSETGRLFSNSMPALGYVHDDKDGDDDNDNEDDGGIAGRDGGEDRVQWIANMLKQVSGSNGVTDDSDNDTLAEEEAAAITAHTDYGYGDGGDAAPSRSLAAILEQPDDAPRPVASPVKRRRVTRRNSFVIPRGRGLVAGLLDLQDAGKFDFGTNEHNET